MHDMESFITELKVVWLVDGVLEVMHHTPGSAGGAASGFQEGYSGQNGCGVLGSWRYRVR